jgi:hypothetical protein
LSDAGGPDADALDDGLLGAALPCVRESDDAGGYYCAHAFFLAHDYGRREAACVARDEAGEPLLGFLHVPPDERTLTGKGAREPAVRHAETRLVVACALRGYLAAAATAVPEGELRLLVTGYGSFRDVVDNPTGDFVGDAGNLRACVAHLGLKAEPATGVAPGAGLRALEFALELAGEPRSVRLAFGVLAVHDAALDGPEERSLSEWFQRFGPHAWLGLGVGRTSHYRAERAPDDRGLERQGGRAAHVAGREPTRVLPTNRSLARALQLGVASLDVQDAPASSPRKSRLTKPGPP